MTTTNQRAVEEKAAKTLQRLYEAFGAFGAGKANDEDMAALKLAITTLRTPGWRPISEDLGWPEGVAFIAEVMPDWTSMQLRDGSCYAFNRATGRVYKVPHPECPFVIVPNLPPLPHQGRARDEACPSNGLWGRVAFAGQPSCVDA